MTKIRTKQQIAFDGVQTVWHKDAFTEILQMQASAPFSMDGVVSKRVGKSTVITLKDKKHFSIFGNTTKPFKEIIGGMDGVRLGWKRTCTAQLDVMKIEITTCCF